MDRVDVLLEPLRTLWLQFAAFLPRLVVGLVVLAAGVVVAKALSFAVRRGLRAINFHIVTQRSGMDGFMNKGGTELDTTDLFGLLVYWLVILGALVLAFNSMDLAYVTDLLGRATIFIARVVVALMIVALGSYFAGFVGQAVVTYCETSGIYDAEALGRLAQYAILAFVIMLALEHMEIGGAIVRQSFLILLGGVVLALALAFGIGGKDWAAAHLEKWWPASSSPPSSKKDKVL
jgi:hypothetical protein